MPDEIFIEIDHDRKTAKATCEVDTIKGIEPTWDSCECGLNPISVTFTWPIPYPDPPTKNPRLS